MIDKTKRLISRTKNNGYQVKTRKSYQLAAVVRRERRIQYGLFQVQLFGGKVQDFSGYKVGTGPTYP